MFATPIAVDRPRIIYGRSHWVRENAPFRVDMAASDSVFAASAMNGILWKEKS
jgi:hypothetical protein